MKKELCGKTYRHKSQVPPCAENVYESDKSGKNRVYFTVDVEFLKHPKPSVDYYLLPCKRELIVTAHYARFWFDKSVCEDCPHKKEE